MKELLPPILFLSFVAWIISLIFCCGQANSCKRIKKYRLMRKDGKILLQYYSPWWFYSWITVGSEWARYIAPEFSRVIHRDYIHRERDEYYMFKRLDEALEVRDKLNELTLGNKELTHQDLYYQRAVEELEKNLK